jgi:hypothetical protein
MRQRSALGISKVGLRSGCLSRRCRRDRVPRGVPADDRRGTEAARQLIAARLCRQLRRPPQANAASVSEAASAVRVKMPDRAFSTRGSQEVFWLASEPETVELDCALGFESPPNSRPSMVCLCRASCFCRLLSSYRYCRSARWLRGLINSRRHVGTATASCRAMISHRITAFQLTPRKLRFRAWRAATGALGISIQSQVITGTMATGTISAGLAFTAVATMAAALALAGRGRRSGRSGIAVDQAIA